MKTNCIIIYITAANKQEAEQIGRTLVEKKLAACSNIVDPINSIFSWKGDICQEKETLLMLKTMQNKFDIIVHEVKNLHSYETPEIIALPIIAGSDDYLSWIKEETE